MRIFESMKSSKLAILSNLKSGSLRYLECQDNRPTLISRLSQLQLTFSHYLPICSHLSPLFTVKVFHNELLQSLSLSPATTLLFTPLCFLHPSMRAVQKYRKGKKIPRKACWYQPTCPYCNEFRFTFFFKSKLAPNLKHFWKLAKKSWFFWAIFLLCAWNAKIG